MRVVILHSDPGESSGKDEEDTLVQVDAVTRLLEERGDEVVRIPFHLDFHRTVRDMERLRPSFVFNLVEAVEGTGRLIHTAPAILDHLEIPYSGAGTEAVILTSNKLIAKKFLHASQLPTPSWFFPNDPSVARRPRVEFPCIVKSVWEHASIGLDEESIVVSGGEDELLRRIRERRESLGGDWFAESFIEGREFNISVLGGDAGPEVLPQAEMRFDGFPPGKARVVGYRAKWEAESFEYHHTRRSFDFDDKDTPLLREMRDLAVECWRLFELRGYARVDFRVDVNNRPWILEVNANPCLSPDAGFLAAADRAGLEFGRVIERIVEDSLGFH
ncbi:MAG: D-alanine--D-alanine ligase [Syntrophobacteraceae bacterium]|nr:ATP-grasp domain-containing protein [Desulfobacteraceae bacterium]